MTPESALPCSVDIAIKEERRKQSASGSPERFLGRLVNLREQLTDPDLDRVGHVTYARETYSAIIDDLDDIIRCIERGIKDPDACDEDCADDCPMQEPDSEDTEAR